MNDSAAIRDLRRIPGVGPTIARDLLRLGIRSVPELRGADPQALYEALCRDQGMHVDRCMLYVFRCAVYFAEDGPHEPELLLWWSWKDGGSAFSSTRVVRERADQAADPVGAEQGAAK